MGNVDYAWIQNLHINIDTSTPEVGIDMRDNYMGRGYT